MQRPPRVQVDLPPCRTCGFSGPGSRLCSAPLPSKVGIDVTCLACGDVVVMPDGWSATWIDVTPEQRRRWKTQFDANRELAERLSKQRDHREVDAATGKPCPRCGAETRYGEARVWREVRCVKCWWGTFAYW